MYGNDNICDKCGNDKTKNNANSILVAMANQTKKKIQVFDISTGNMNDPVWEYDITVGGVSGFKVRNFAPYGDVLLVTVGTNVEMVAVDTKEVVWRTSNAPANAHSLDIMPNGIIAVGGTVGHDVHFYNINGEDPTEILYELPLQDAHGVLWDPEYEVLWVLGRTNLWALNVTLNADGTVTVVKNETLSVTMPMDHGHDLQPYYGHTDKLLVTGETMMIFDKKTKEFTEVLDQHSTKAFCVLPNGDFIYMFPDGLHEQWNTTYVNILDADTGEITKIESNQGRFYKCRVWNYNYQ
jgi:hypothetical protein